MRLEHKDLYGTIEHDPEDNILHGRAINASGIIGYEGSNLEELEADFRAGVESYLQTCAEHNISPFKSGAAPYDARPLSAKVVDADLVAEAKELELVLRLVTEECDKFKSRFESLSKSRPVYTGPIGGWVIDGEPLLPHSEYYAMKRELEDVKAELAKLRRDGPIEEMSKIHKSKQDEESMRTLHPVLEKIMNDPVNRKGLNDVMFGGKKSSIVKVDGKVYRIDKFSRPEDPSVGGAGKGECMSTSEKLSEQLRNFALNLTEDVSAHSLELADRAQALEERVAELMRTKDDPTCPWPCTWEQYDSMHKQAKWTLGELNTAAARAKAAEAEVAALKAQAARMEKYDVINSEEAASLRAEVARLRKDVDAEEYRAQILANDFNRAREERDALRARLEKVRADE